MLIPLLACLLSADPALVCDRPSQDLGVLVRGAKVTHVFRLRNQGRDPVTLRDVVPSCSCTTAPLARGVLAPGEELPLEATFDSTGFEGAVSKTLVVTSDDAARPALVLELKARVQARIAATPPILRMPDLLRDSQIPGSVALRRADGKPLKVLGAALRGVSALEVEVLPGEDDASALVRVHVRSGAPLGPFQGHLVVQVEDSLQPRVEIPVQGSLLPDLSAFPEALDLGSLAPGAPAMQGVRVLAHRMGVHPPGVQVEPPLLEAALEARKGFDGSVNGWTLRLRVRPDAPKGTHQGRILLGQGASSTSVPFRVTVLPEG